MATDIVKQIRRKTRRKFSADEKIRIVLERVAPTFMLKYNIRKRTKARSRTYWP